MILNESESDKWYRSYPGNLTLSRNNECVSPHIDSSNSYSSRNITIRSLLVLFYCQSEFIQQYIFIHASFQKIFISL